MRVRVPASVLLVVLLAISSFAATAQPASRVALTIEAITDGSLSVPAPSELRWAPDGRLSYLLAVEEEDEETGKGEEGAEPEGGEAEDGETEEGEGGGGEGEVSAGHHDDCVAGPALAAWWLRTRRRPGIFWA